MPCSILICSEMVSFHLIWTVIFLYKLLSRIYKSPVMPSSYNLLNRISWFTVSNAVWASNVARKNGTFCESAKYRASETIRAVFSDETFSVNPRCKRFCVGFRISYIVTFRTLSSIFKKTFVTVIPR